MSIYMTTTHMLVVRLNTIIFDVVHETLVTHVLVFIADLNRGRPRDKTVRSRPVYIIHIRNATKAYAQDPSNSPSVNFSKRY